MTRTVIFDMDGVIVDTEPVHYQAFRAHFQQLGIEVPDAVYATFTGTSTRNMYQRLKEMYGLEHEVEQLIDIKRALFNDAFDTKADLVLLPGVERFIKDLHSNGMQLILASSSAKVTIDRIFTRFGLYPYFTHIVSGKDFPESKPDPAIFNHAASLSQAPREQCIVIEDSTNGIRAAKSAGLFCIGYDSAHSRLQDLREADMVIKDFAELNYSRICALR